MPANRVQHRHCPPPDEVFSCISDPSRFAEWQADVLSVHVVAPGPPSLGSSSRCRTLDSGRTL
jgi:hypothetical protein